MFKFTFHDIPTNHTIPYTVQYRTIKEGLDASTHTQHLVSIVDSDDAVHYGVITEEGELRNRATYGIAISKMKLHQSQAYIDATTCKKVAKLA
jgi:hypothetical protein